MAEPQALLAFLGVCLLVELTPGPNMAYLLLLSAGRGRAVGLVAVAGVTLGLLAYLLAAAFGLTQVVMAWPGAWTALRVAGVAYLVWLAAEAWFQPAGGKAAAAAADRDAHRTAAGVFGRGLLANLLNPKAAIFYLSLLPEFVRPERGSPLTQALVLGAVHIAVATAIHVSLVFGGSAAMRSPVATRLPRLAIQRAMAVGLILTAAWLGVASAR